MRKKMFIILGISFMTFHTAFTQIQPLTGNEIPGAILVDTDSYDGEGLWGYIDGGADIFMEYGFNHLLVQKFLINDQNFKLEAYLMNTPQAAYGIYSVNILKCISQDSLNTFDCLTRYQYQAAYGKFYLSVITETDSPLAWQNTCTIAQKFNQLNPQDTFDLPTVFNAPRFEGNRDQVVFLSGLLGMQNSLFPWQELILGVRYAMYAVILPDPDGDIFFAQISFPTPADMNNFLTHARLMSNGVPVQAYNNYNFLFREFVPLDSPDNLTIYFLQSIQPEAIANITAD